jgi:hypothetical protein
VKRLLFILFLTGLCFSQALAQTNEVRPGTWILVWDDSQALPCATDSFHVPNFGPGVSWSEIVTTVEIGPDGLILSWDGAYVGDGQYLPLNFTARGRSTGTANIKVAIAATWSNCPL